MGASDDQMNKTRACVVALLLASAVAAPTLDRAVRDDVHTVHLLFSHHLDVGLNAGLEETEFCDGFATKIIQEYFDDFIPRAIRLADDMKDSAEPFAYTIHPWIASLYVDCVPWDILDGCKGRASGQLRCPSQQQVASFDEAVRAGRLLWADSPFNVDAGIIGEPSMVDGMVDIASSLNERYNLTKKERVWSNIDVPGFARSTIPLLRRAGITALSICANVGEPAFGPRKESLGTVPKDLVGNLNATMFRWRDPISSEDLLVLYHQSQHDNTWDIPLPSTFDTYGGYTRPDNMLITDSGVALASFIGSDNTGPPLTTWEVKRIFNKVRSIFPNAKIFGSTWDAFVADIPPQEIAALPEHSSEWGDEWLTGMPTDPVRLSTYRALMRARGACIASGACQIDDPVVRNFTRFAAKIPEHTQGVDAGGNLACIYKDILHTPCVGPQGSSLSNADFAKNHNSNKNIFPGADDSYLEARYFNTLAIQAVPLSHPLSHLLTAELAALEPRPPQVPAPLASSVPPAIKCQSKSSFASLNFTSSGSLDSLAFGTDSAEWNRLMDLRYITSTQHAPQAVDKAWSSTLLGLWSDTNTRDQLSDSCHVVVQLGFNSSLHKDYGAPLTVLVEYTLNPDSKRLDATFTWQNKSSTLLQEAMSVFSTPTQRAGYEWSIDSLGEWVSLTNVTEGGERYKHAAWSGIKYSSREPDAAALHISTLDAGMVCPVLNSVWDSRLTPEIALQQSCFDYGGRDGQLLRPITDTAIEGLGINLHNNRMGISGFAEWYPFGVGDRYQKQDETAQFRFVIEER